MEEEYGYCYVATKSESEYRLKLSEFARVKYEFMNGTHPFIESIGIWGDKLVIKKAEIELISEITPEIYTTIQENRRLREIS